MTKKLTLLLIIASIFALQAPALAQESTTAIPEEITNMKSEGFTIVPGDPNTISPRKFIFEGEPGSTMRDTVLIQNLSNEEATFSLYGADPTFSSQGTPAYKTRDAGGDGEGRWITFDEPSITLKAREERTVPFTLTIPEDTPLGDYRAGVAMEKTKQDINNPNIIIATRLIIHSDIKVTDNPSVVPKQNGAQGVEEPKEDSPLQIYYFWISLALFVISFIALVWITFEEKKSPVSTFTTSAAAGGSKSQKKKTTSTRKKKPVARKTSTTKSKSKTTKSTTRTTKRKSTTRKKK